MGLKKFMKKKAVAEGQTSHPPSHDSLAPPVQPATGTPPAQSVPRITSPPRYTPMVISSHGTEDDILIPTGVEVNRPDMVHGGSSRPSAPLALISPYLASKRIREEAGSDGFLSLSAGGDVDTIIHLMKKMSLPGDEDAYAALSPQDRYNELVLCTSKVRFLYLFLPLLSYLC